MLGLTGRLHGRAKIWRVAVWIVLGRKVKYGSKGNLTGRAKATRLRSGTMAGRKICHGVETVAS